MGKFAEWCKDRNFTLPTEVKDEAEVKNKKKIDEKQARAGTAHWAYPDGYVKAHYPKSYFMPRAADAEVKLGDK